LTTTEADEGETMAPLDKFTSTTMETTLESETEATKQVGKSFFVHL
jgi:hypothetical protein